MQYSSITMIRKSVIAPRVHSLDIPIFLSSLIKYLMPETFSISHTHYIVFPNSSRKYIQLTAVFHMVSPTVISRYAPFSRLYSPKMLYVRCWMDTGWILFLPVYFFSSFVRNGIRPNEQLTKAGKHCPRIQRYTTFLGITEFRLPPEETMSLKLNNCICQVNR